MSTAGFTIETEADLAAAMQALTEADPRLAAVARHLKAEGVSVPLRRVPPGFEALLRLIVAQQVSLESAAAIWSRTAAAGLTSPAACLSGGPDALTAAGFSRAKIRYALALAEAVAEGDLDLGGLAAPPDGDAARTLVKIPGIGRWTADLYLLSALGRPDVWPVGDIALRAGAERALGLAARPGTAEMEDLAEPWRPLRSVAARLLWSFYKLPKSSRV